MKPQKPIQTTTPTPKAKLTKDGLVYKNNLLNTDYTSGQPTQRKLKK